MTGPPTVSVVIPTCGRDTVLTDTVSNLLELPSPPAQIIVADQTTSHDADSERSLQRWHERGRIRWLRLSRRSIPHAMNRGLLAAAGPVVLFLDDDVIPDDGLVEAHARSHAEEPGCLIAGRVLQPWNEGCADTIDKPSQFNSPERREVTEFMGGNFSVPRDAALTVGGFDESFVRVAYRFEAEFSYRWLRSGRRIQYEPVALIHHLKTPSGGTRDFGSHLTTWGPAHAVGAYYCLMRTKPPLEAACGAVQRLIRSVATRHHLRRPWWIPATLVAELSGLAWGLGLAVRSPHLIWSDPDAGASQLPMSAESS